MNLFALQSLETYKKNLSLNGKFNKVERRVEKNGFISYLYRKLGEETGDETYSTLASRIFYCSQFYQIDYYLQQAVKDVQRTYYCHNRFCDNCQNAYAVSREHKFSPLLDELSKHYDIFHIVFTVPNCFISDLKSTLQNMYYSFPYVIRYLTGNAKVKGIDFLKYGYLGCIRSLEITKSKLGDFHPHFHCIFVFKKGFSSMPDLKRYSVNSYSFNNPDLSSHKKKIYGKPERLFSRFEILLQKIWRLKIDGIKVTRENLDGIKEGYSVIADPCKGRYHQVFKYSTKGILKCKDKDDMIYRDFKELHFSLFRRRVVQGYGIFFNFDFESVDNSTDFDYERCVAILRSNEFPLPEFESLSELLDAQRHTDKVVYISCKSFKRIVEVEI